MLAIWSTSGSFDLRVMLGKLTKIRNYPSGTMNFQEMSFKSSHDFRFLVTDQVSQFFLRVAFEEKPRGHQNILLGLEKTSNMAARLLVVVIVEQTNLSILRLH